MRGPDGSGGVTNYLTLDGSGKIQADKPVCLSDGVYLNLGSGNDFDARHNGSDFQARCSTGDMVFIQADSDQDMVFQCDNGSGSPTPYITLDGSQAVTTLQKRLRAEDGVKIELGTGADFQLRHTGAHALVSNDTGNLTFQQAANDSGIIFQNDDGNGGTAEYFRLDGSQADGTNVYTRFPDNSRIALGSSNDFQLFHNGSNTRLVQNTGELSIEQQATDQIITLQADNGSGGITPYLTVSGSREEVVASKPLIQTPGTVDPANNGELAFTVVSNTSIKLKYKGTDGVVRSTSLTLS